jgi:hypothetical protein
MHRLVSVASFMLACLLLPSSGEAQTRGSSAAFQAAFGPCSGNICVIRYNPGGEINRFLAAAQAVRAGALRQVVIDGPCLSACAIFADIARERVCITNRASFGFHKARLYAVQPARGGRSHYREVRREDPRHSRDIAGWVHRNGGFPHEGYLVMDARQASQFWRPCR